MPATRRKASHNNNNNNDTTTVAAASTNTPTQHDDSATAAAIYASADTSTNGHHNLADHEHTLDDSIDYSEVPIDPSLDDMNNAGLGPPPGLMMHQQPQQPGQPLMQESMQDSMLEEGDNRTRNAKAQRRHREKRKAHLKAVSGCRTP